MSTESNNNNLENFFRNSLNNLSAEPSTPLWERIEAGIPPKPGRRVNPVYLAFIALILLLLTALILQHFAFNDQMKDMALQTERQQGDMETLRQNFENQLAELSGQVEALSKTIVEPTSKSDYIQTATVTRHPNNGAMKTSDVERYGVDLRPAGDQTISLSGLPEAKNNPSMRFFGEGTDQDEHTIHEKEIQVASFEEKAELLDYLASIPVFSNVENDRRLKNVKLPGPKSSSTSVEAYTAVYRTFPRINLSPSGNRSNEFESYLSKSAGALINFGINRKWDVQLGLGFSKMKVSDEVTKVLYYDNEESDGNGRTYSSSYRYTVKTDYGDLLISSLLVNEKANDGQDIKAGDQFQLNVKFQKAIRYVNLPVFVRYKIGQKRLRYAIKGGIIQKFLYDEGTKLSSVTAQSERLMNNVSMIEEDLGSVRQSSTDALLGLGVEYRLTKRNQINVESIFVQSLNEIYKDIQPFSIGIQLGLQHRLGK